MIANKDLPAFANPGSEYGPGSGGLTKREYIASMAMQPIIAAVYGGERLTYATQLKEWQEKYGDIITSAAIAKDAVELADALLKEFVAPK